MKSSTFFFVLLVIISPAMVVSATIEPSLEKQLSGAQQGEKLNVILALYNPRDIQALDQDLHFMHAGRVERYLTAYKALRANAAETQASVIKQIEAYELAGEIEYHKAYWIGNLIVVHGTAVTILNLANHPAVKSVGPNSSIALMDPVMRGPLRSSRPDHLDEEQTTPGQDAIHATQVNRELGITGQGVLVANCDTGVDGAHPALASRWRGTHAATSECWLSFAGNPNFPVDEWGHGTHVMGTICGREIDGYDTNTVGSAPNAEWIASDALMGSSLVQDILDTYEWFADPDGDPETMDDVPDVVQNSWRVFEDCYDEWNTVILNLEALGCVVTWSAGNEGPGAQSMGAPPELQFNPTQIFSVGAVDATGDPTPPYTIADFSSRGPSGCEPDPDAFKPEVVAPGVDVYSCVPGGDYAGGWSGTSMAGPHVAGCVALMREACPDCDPQTIKEAILNSCIDYGGAGDDNTYGMGFIDAYEAVLLVYNLGRVDGYITTSTGTPVGGARVQALDATHAVYSGANGYYNLSLPEGMHTIRYTKFGYETVTIENVEATEGDTVHIDVEMNQVPTGTLAGTVVTQVGIPIQNAIVVIQNAPIDTMISDAFGRIFVTLPATTYDVYLEMTVNTNPPTVYTANPTVTVQAEDTTFEDLEIFIDLIEPVGPDAYGYFAYDRYDRDLPAPADWIELDPEIGNPGVAFEFVHHDSALYFDAPFPLKFYGEWSEMLTVNPNGWMLPGYVTGPGAENTPIPSNQNNDPPGIIAPFWDDMRIG